MGYKVLKFEPNQLSKTPKENILWIGQMEDIDANNKRDLKNLKEVCSHDHRFTLQQWEERFNVYDYKIVKNYDHDFAMEYLLEDGDFIVAIIQLFACDVESSYYKLEVPQDDILPILSVLSLPKTASMFPTKLLTKIENALEKLEFTDNQKNIGIMKQVELLKSVAEHCQTYEVDVKWDIVDIS